MNLWLATGGVLSASAALLHVAIVFRGTAWYRRFGAGETFARAAERGERWPDAITLAIAAVLLAWGAYALAGAGLVRDLPWMSAVLSAITAIYLLRGLAIVPALLWVKGDGRAFAIGSSLICLLYGIVHAIGLLRMPGFP